MNIFKSKKTKINFVDDDDLKNRKDLMLIQNDEELKVLAAKSVEFCEKYLGVAWDPGDNHTEECMVIAMGACIVLGFDFFSENEDVSIKLRQIKKQVVPDFEPKFSLKKLL